MVVGLHRVFCRAAMDSRLRGRAAGRDGRSDHSAPHVDLSKPSKARRLANILGVDAVVVGSVTDYTPYYPPAVSLARGMVRGEPGIPRDCTGIRLAVGHAGRRVHPCPTCVRVGIRAGKGAASRRRRRRATSSPSSRYCRHRRRRNQGHFEDCQCTRRVATMQAKGDWRR